MSRKNFKILLIDDDEDDYIEIKETLGEIVHDKYELIWKSSYDDGLNTLLKNSFDACILDYRLGQKTGLEFLAEARLKGSQCPIIVLTGHGDRDLDLKSMEAGAADYLVKGQIPPQVLERSIRYSIKNAHDLQELAEERENFQTLFNSTFEGILVASEDKILAANRAVCDIFKCSSKDIIGKDLSKFLHQEVRDQMSLELKSGRHLRTECSAKTLDGRDIYLGFSSRTINFKGQWTSLIAIRDLTERRMMETQLIQQDRLASMGLLASSLAHEIGTPLGVIRGRAEQVQKNADEKTKNTMGIIVSQIDRISKLVISLLSIGRSNNVGSASDVRLNLVLNDVLALMSHELNKNEIEVNLNINDNIVVRAESGPLGQVFLNLLVNAIHAILSDKSKKSRWINISAVEADQAVQISVEDNGIGIRDEDFLRLFQPFFTTKEIGEGTGLGLATSYKLVKSWGGSIQVQSKIGCGTTFTVILQK